MNAKAKNTPSAKVGKINTDVYTLTIVINKHTYMYANKNIPDAVVTAVEEHVEKGLEFSTWIHVTETVAGTVVETHEFYSPGILSGFNFVDDPTNFILNIALGQVEDIKGDPEST